ncbi:hypothetical protein JTE90_023355 [Oedothorax gibbosus]|uniref:Uncharacterized protein n=1 Tax=Oedothorax gibbosus TaxID=931172 RepID=A0AAV6U912_9ARAC|nr:hypothetical protein JTE90_023355 [Oedothorax gibbosus]
MAVSCFAGLDEKSAGGEFSSHMRIFRNSSSSSDLRTFFSSHLLFGKVCIPLFSLELKHYSQQQVSDFV